MCFPGAVEIAKLGDWLCLCVHDGKYFLCDRNGHDKFFEFPEKPIPDPDPECDINGPDEAADGWVEMMDRLEQKLVIPATDGYFLVRQAKKQGWGTDGFCGGCFAGWLLNWAGQRIATYEAVSEGVKQAKEGKLSDGPNLDADTHIGDETPICND